jgi:hypothetical protein
MTVDHQQQTHAKYFSSPEPPIVPRGLFDLTSTDFFPVFSYASGGSMKKLHCGFRQKFTLAP